MAVLEGMVAIGLDVQLSALGSTLETRIAGHGVKLRMPRPPLAADGIGLRGGELTAPIFDRFRDGERLREWIHDDTPSPAWGKCYMRGPNGGGAAWVRRGALAVALAAECSMDRRRDVADAIFREGGPWRDCVLDWLEIAFGQPLRATGPSRIGTAIDPWLWSHDADGQRWVEHYNNQPLTVAGSSGESAVDASSLRQVLRVAGVLIRPPLAWRLTRDARRQQATEDHRRAVLDAGAAAELALYALLPRHGWKPAIKKNGKESQYTLGPLIEAANQYPAVRIADAASGLLKVRNDATHRAEMPSGQTAARALQISAQYVEWAWPRSALLADANSG